MDPHHLLFQLIDDLPHPISNPDPYDSGYVDFSKGVVLISFFLGDV
jgi:hypothetical protein